MRVLVVATVAAFAATAGTFGTVVPIGGEASDLTLDEVRGVLYIADFTANRIEVMSLATNTIQSSINVAAQPSSMDMSADGHYLVVTHFGNFAAPLTGSNLVTIIDLTTMGQQVLALPSAPLGVAFGADGKALVATSTEFLVLNPALGTFTLLATVADVTANTLPAPPANFPPQITSAALGASGDRTRIYGISNTIRFYYDATYHRIFSGGYTSTPPLGPLTVSVNQKGTFWAAGWILFDAAGDFYSQFPNVAGLPSTGTIAIDNTRYKIYAQMPASGATPGTGNLPQPTLMITDGDNLAIDEQILLPENLGGKSVLTSNGATMYSVSDSGVTVLPLALLPATPQIQTDQTSMLFTGSYCLRGVSTQNLVVFDPSGNQTPFSISTAAPGITVQPAYGVTPAVVQVSVDPTAYLNQNGTAVATLQITSPNAVNVPNSVNVLVNTRSPDQRGTILNVPGNLVDILPDPVRDRFYVLRQDQNEVLVFDGSTYSQIATLRTNNTPTQMAITYDDNWLLVGHDNSQFLYVFNLNTLQPSTPVKMPSGHYPRSVAASANAILTANRVAGPLHTIDRVNLVAATATALPSLGAFKTASISTPCWWQRLMGPASWPRKPTAICLVRLHAKHLHHFATGLRLTGRRLRDIFVGVFAGRQSSSQRLTGAVAQFENQTGSSSGFAFINQTGFRTTVSSSSLPGMIERVDVSTSAPYTSSPTRTAEAPLAGNGSFAFTRTLAPLSNQTAILELTTSGLTVLPWAYDASVAPPSINRVVSAADGSPALAPGGLIALYGAQLSPVSLVSSQIPLPTALGDSCLTVDGLAVPVMFVSPNQINAQLPFEATGNVTFTLFTPGGTSNNFNTVVSSAAPSIFMSGSAGPQTELPTIIRANNNNQLVTPSDPISGNDTLIIYLTGLGITSPQVPTGFAAPLSPLSYTVGEPSVTLGGVPLNVMYSGLTPTLVGVYQINLTVPKNVPQGISVPLSISLGGNTTTVNVRVTN